MSDSNSLSFSDSPPMALPAESDPSSPDDSAGAGNDGNGAIVEVTVGVAAGAAGVSGQAGGVATPIGGSFGLRVAGAIGAGIAVLTV